MACCAILEPSRERLKLGAQDLAIARFSASKRTMSSPRKGIAHIHVFLCDGSVFVHHQRCARFLCWPR